jgi:hypothetical protein
MHFGRPGLLIISIIADGVFSELRRPWPWPRRRFRTHRDRGAVINVDGGYLAGGICRAECRSMPTLQSSAAAARTRLD